MKWTHCILIDLIMRGPVPFGNSCSAACRVENACTVERNAPNIEYTPAVVAGVPGTGILGNICAIPCSKYAWASFVGCDFIVGVEAVMGRWSLFITDLGYTVIHDGSIGWVFSKHAAI
jgi:hypothetical protein